MLMSHPMSLNLSPVILRLTFVTLFLFFQGKNSLRLTGILRGLCLLNLIPPYILLSFSLPSEILTCSNSVTSILPHVNRRGKPYVFPESQSFSVCPSSTEGMLCSGSLGVHPERHRGSVERFKESRSSIPGLPHSIGSPSVMCEMCTRALKVPEYAEVWQALHVYQSPSCTFLIA